MKVNFENFLCAALVESYVSPAVLKLPPLMLRYNILNVNNLEYLNNILKKMSFVMKLQKAKVEFNFILRKRIKFFDDYKLFLV